ncbi:MAG: Imm27 family immunity protein [Acidobacteriota bacterium]
MLELRPTEKELIGKWIKVNDKIVADPVQERIEWLINNRLQKVGTDESGWDTLFQDEADGRFWERIYPDGYMHGGGPPALIYLSEQEATRKYSKLFKSFAD